MFIEKLKKNIKEKPKKGLLDPILYKGKELPCRKQSVRINLFSRHNTMGYSFITAHYLYKGDEIIIVNMRYF